jgi:hypothetical protein
MVEEQAHLPCQYLPHLADNSWRLLTRFRLRPSRWRHDVPPKRRLTLNGLYGIISQKIVTPHRPHIVCMDLFVDYMRPVSLTGHCCKHTACCEPES